MTQGQPGWWSILAVALLAVLTGCNDAPRPKRDLGAGDGPGAAREAGVRDLGVGEAEPEARDLRAEAAPAPQPDAGSLTGECQNYEIAHPAWLWCDDFESGQALDQTYPDTGSEGFAVSTADALSGSRSVQQHYETGQSGAGWLFWFYSDALGQSHSPPQDEIYLRWYHKFEPGFEGVPPKMARLSSIGPGWDKRFAVHYWINAEAYIVADVHVPYSSQANSAGWLPVANSSFSYKDPANIGRWICHEMYVRINTPGQADGAYTFWADSQEILSRTGVDLRGATTYNFNAVQLDCYWNNGSPRPQNRYYDNFVVATERIGCGAP